MIEFVRVFKNLSSWVFKKFEYHCLDKAKSLFNCGTRMEKALQRLADAEMTSQSVLSVKSMNEANSTNESSIEKIVTSVVDTPPATPTVQSLHTSTLLRGIPKALLEKVSLFNK